MIDFANDTNVPSKGVKMPTRLIKELEGKTAEEQCDFIRWLVLDYAMCFTDSREAVIEWLKGNKNE